MLWSLVLINRALIIINHKQTNKHKNKQTKQPVRACVRACVSVLHSYIPGECGVCAPDAEAEWHQSPGPDQARRAPHSKGGLD